MSPAFADRWTASLERCMGSVHPRVDLVAELVRAVHLQRALGVVRRVHATRVGVTPGALQVGALGERAPAGGLEQRVDRVDRPLRAEDLVAAYLQPEAERDRLALRDQRDLLPDVVH